MRGRDSRTQYWRDLVLANRDMTDVTVDTVDEIASAVGLLRAVNAAVKDYAGKDEFAKWQRIILDIATVAREHGVGIDPKALRKLKQAR